MQAQRALLIGQKGAKKFLERYSGQFGLRLHSL